MSKYKIEVIDGLSRVVALKDFADVKKGDVGGFVENYKCLSQEGDCWVYPDAKVYGGGVFHNAKVYGNARVTNCYLYDNTEICGNATAFNSTFYGNSLVTDNAKVNYSEVRNSKIFGKTNLDSIGVMPGYIRYIENSTLTDEAYIYPQGFVHNAHLCKKAVVYNIFYDAKLDREQFYRVIFSSESDKELPGRKLFEVSQNLLNFDGIYVKPPQELIRQIQDSQMTFLTPEFKNRIVQQIQAYIDYIQQNS